MRFRADYARHERIYAARPNASGWNTPEIDQQALAWARELLAHSGLTPPARIVELGCGMGNLGLELARDGFDITGVDISPTAIAIATARAAQRDVRASFTVGDITAPGWLDEIEGLGAFDAALDSLFLHCVIGEDRARALRAIHTALRPSGALLVMTMCGDPRSQLLQERFDSATRLITDGTVADRYLGLAPDLRSELEEAGFEARYARIETGDSSTGDQDMYLAAVYPIRPPVAHIKRVSR